MIVSGSVTYNGKPIVDGMIRFVPVQTSSAPTAGAYIINGKYIDDGHGGVPIGLHKVQIEAFRPYKSDRKQDASPPLGLPANDLREQFLPKKFNSGTSIEIDIPSGARQITKNFDLAD